MSLACCPIGFVLTLGCIVEAVDLNILFNTNSRISKKWSDDYISSNIEIRLVKRTWFPGPTPNNTDVVPDQAPYEVEEAYKILKTTPLYTFESHPLKEAENLFLSSGYDPSKETIVVIHTISEDADEKFAKTTVTALALRNFHVQYNVFTVHMPELNNLMAVTVKRVFLGFHNQYSVLGRIIAGFLQTGINMKKLQPGHIHLIGFCFSAQLTGYVAKALPGTEKSIIALDPYSFGFSLLSMIPLSKHDAEIVHILHTSSFLQGTARRFGTADFVFNNGNLQPGCPLTDVTCSHGRSLPFLWYAILYSELFIARQCKNYISLRLCFCEKNPTTQITYPLNPKASGTYYIRTSEHHPYGVKDRGTSCRPLWISEPVHTKKP